MSRFRMYPTPVQASVMRDHNSHARFVWNLAVEQFNLWQRWHGPTANFAEQCKQLTEARSASDWLRSGSQTVQQQALRDFDRAKSGFFSGAHRRPTWRKRGVHEGFRIVGPQAQRVEQLSRKWARVLVPKVGWVKFRLTRSALPEARSYRVTYRSRQWHIAFAVIPDPIPAPGTGEVVGVDRGVAVSAALSTGELLSCPGLTDRELVRLKHLSRRLARCERGSSRRKRVKAAMATLHRRGANRRKDWVEKTSTDLARRFDVIRLEDLKVAQMLRKPAPKPNQARPGAYLPNGRRAKAGLNLAIAASGWTMLAVRLRHKAAGRVEKVNPAFTSQTCSACGHSAPENREIQAVFKCGSCGYSANADVNAAINIAAGHAVSARGGTAVLVPVMREPQRAPS
jgi:transposase